LTYLRIIYILVALLILTACTSKQALQIIDGVPETARQKLQSLQPIEGTPEAARQNFKIGDTIIVYTLDNTIYEFKVVKITDYSIEGPRQTIPFQEIQKLEKQEASVRNTLGAGADKETGTSYLAVTGLVVVLFLVSLL
jgi:hypothetical protein